MAKPLIQIEKNGANDKIEAIFGKAICAIVEDGMREMKECRDYLKDAELIGYNTGVLIDIPTNEVLKSAGDREEAIKAIEKYVTINWV